MIMSPIMFKIIQHFFLGYRKFVVTCLRPLAIWPPLTLLSHFLTPVPSRVHCISQRPAAVSKDAKHLCTLHLSTRAASILPCPITHLLRVPIRRWISCVWTSHQLDCKFLEGGRVFYSSLYPRCLVRRKYQYFNKRVLWSSLTAHLKT